MDRFDLDGRVAIVTGASRGIGCALALGLAEAGAKVVAASRTLEACQDLADRIVAAGGEALAVQVDVGCLDQHQPLLEATIGHFGRLDILVNNAGILRPHLTTRVTPEELDDILAVNLKGPLFLSQAALDHLAAGGTGSIINIGALGAFQPMEGIGAYCAAKAAMANWTTTMSREWAARGVRVNLLVPGPVATDMILPRDPQARARFEDEVAAETIFGRLGIPDDLVGAAVFLASDASAFMSGRPVFVDGGMLR
ncbi:SDR family NAD(P)-dependent oxidoreductase [Candidatus Poriferisocius sp.]|uniref:SDR family NAD(P)-dependent oxidoreductase n=1 Tax=Candidatus Poriferisocius sp. TaxID=3101276 RepID=UPI003B022478